jgi:hypothetical protein
MAPTQRHALLSWPGQCTRSILQPRMLFRIAPLVCALGVQLTAGHHPPASLPFFITLSSLRHHDNTLDADCVEDQSRRSDHDVHTTQRMHSASDQLPRTW